MKTEVRRGTVGKIEGVLRKVEGYCGEDRGGTEEGRGVL